MWPPPAHGSGLGWVIGREAGAPHAAREELFAVVLENGSVEPKPREPLCRWRLQVEVEMRDSRAARLGAPRVEAISVHRREAAARQAYGGSASSQEAMA